MQSLTILFPSLLWFYYLCGKQWENYHLGLSLMVLVCGAKPSSLKAFNASVTLSNASHASDMAPLLMKESEMEKWANQHTRLHLTNTCVSPPCICSALQQASTYHLLCVGRNTSAKQNNLKTVLLLWLGWCFVSGICIRGLYFLRWDKQANRMKSPI